jgi:acetoacetyl-CoA reductase
VTRTALVTGAAGGIGRAIVERLRADGLDVITLDRTGDVDIVLDLASDPLPEDALAEVDVCVPAAGITTTIAAAHVMTAEQWDRDIAVNLTGAFRSIQPCLPGMRERGFGRIVAISSGAARFGLAGQVAYSASKAGLLGMVRTLALEGAPHGITANCILPGVIRTPAVAEMPAHVVERVNEALPADRMGTTEEVAALVAHLASDEAGYITGQTLSVSGGLTMA